MAKKLHWRKGQLDALAQAAHDLAQEAIRLADHSGYDHGDTLTRRDENFMSECVREVGRAVRDLKAGE